MLKYHVSTCGVSAKIAYSEFIGTPLIYAVDPEQIILLAREAGKRIVKVNAKGEIQSSRPIRSRMKWIFHE